MENKSKGQISIEMIVIIGIIIVGTLIFAIYYLSSLNKNIDTATGIDDVNYESFLPGLGDTNDPGDVDPPIPNELCGNGVIDGSEECDGTNLNGNDCTTIEGGFSEGTLSCLSNCTFDTSECSHVIPALDFLELNISPVEGNVIENQKLQTILSLVKNDSPDVELYLNVKLKGDFGINTLTDKCFYDDKQILAEDNIIGLFNNDVEKIADVYCTEVGEYIFEFIGRDIANDFEAVAILNLNVTSEEIIDPLFALCGIESIEGVGNTKLCVNDLTNSSSNSNGLISFYANQPDFSERKDTLPSCVEINGTGKACFYLGIN